MPDGIWGVDAQARESTVAIFDQGTGEVLTLQEPEESTAPRHACGGSKQLCD